MSGGMTLYVGYDLEEIGPMTVSGNDGSAWSWNQTSGRYYHPFSDAGSPITYGSMKAAAELALEAAQATSAWTVTWNHNTLGWTLVTDKATTLVLDTVAQRVFGMNSPKGSATSFTSDFRPWYCMRPSIAAMTRNTEDQEQDVDDERETANGDSFGVWPTTFPIYHDWSHWWEPKAACKRLSATASVPWTWDQLFQHCRLSEPIVVAHAVNTQATVDYIAADIWARVRLRKGGAAFKPRRGVADLDTVFHVDLKTRILERLSETL